MPAYEILFFPASDLFLQDHKAAIPVFTQVSLTDGLSSVRSGFVEEDPKTAYFLLEWETVGHHKALIDHPSYAEVTAKLTPLLGGKPQMYHVELEKDATAALSAPTTEVFWIQLKDGKTKSDFDGILIKHLGPKLMALPGVVSGSARWNSTVEDPSKVFLVLGWESAKKHNEGTQTEEFKGIFSKLAEVGDYTIVHVPFKPFYGSGHSAL